MAARLAKPSLDAGLVSNDLDGLIRFYNGVLGLPLAGSVDIPNVGQVTRFQVGDSVLRVLVPLDPAQPPPAGPRFSSTAGIRYLALRIGNLAETVEQVAQAGFTIAVPLHTLRPGVRVALVEDADGNTIELMEESAP
ncbi:VOC family protein [Rhizorhabdus wittichii]|jgi:catechol 2,3-dioxygenase-like lactoylglutathione lyase family enzyme|uniref:Glyoxalase/bleomycin resistance protein/dioxygenase n=2 Tax=Rhizorhabdus wittichii TaxID=160791 RepID=A0A9J9LDJ1_RHIWR|nr:VOC family protein [Rhizorhabdus wittichii]ABQ68209.1 Glyoxalase/bleomycin resistance protein/dioxygenase [Rhizorhabdus wittichii RW1]QTH21360.1 VOC family protein [Rhizorhabdus wittichii]